MPQSFERMYRHQSCISRMEGACLLLLISLCVTVFDDAQAQQTDPSPAPPIINWQQLDIDQDGEPDVAIWTTTWRGSSFSMTVFDGGHDMIWSTNWPDATDFANDVWLIDHNSDSTYELVIRFSIDGDAQLRASLWDDQDNDGRVEVTIDGRAVAVTESQHPSLIVSTTGNWPDSTGRLFGDLAFLYDGVPPQQELGFLSDFLTHDGQPDSEMRLVDNDNNGVIDYSYNRLLQIIPERYGIPREGLQVNVGSVVPEHPADYLFWPLLNYDPSYQGRNYFSSPSFVQIDWDSATIVNFGITGYPIEKGYHVNNLNRWEQGTTNQANFENAMSYYDLADNDDSLPELHIRHVYWPHKDSLYPRNDSLDVNEVVYSWRISESRELTWDYKLSLLGSNPITTTIPYDEFSLYVVPYWELPRWVIKHQWDIATFVTVEDREYVSSEGIYEWSTSEGVVNDISAARDDTRYQLTQRSGNDQALCINGGSDCELGVNYFDIAVGLSGEYGQLGDQPTLYLSPIDNRLHLKWAEHGIWRLDAEHIIRLTNLDGDESIDVWSREAITATVDMFGLPLDKGAEENSAAAEPDVMETLYALDGYLLHTDGANLTLAASDYEPILFETLPPTDHNTWEAHRAQLAPYEAQRRDPTDLGGWLDAFSGPRSEITGASLANVRITNDGFRFELTLEPDYRITGPDLLGLEGLAPGDYLIDHHDGAFLFAPLIPAQLSLTVLQANKDSAAALAQVTIDNTGSADASDLILVVEGKNNSGTTIELARQPVQAFAGQMTQVAVDILSPLGASEVLRAQLDDSRGEVVVASEWTPLTGPDTSYRAAIFGIGKAPVLLPVAGMFAALIVLAALSAVIRRRGQPAP